VLLSGAMQQSEVLLADRGLPGTGSKERLSEELKGLSLCPLIFIHKFCHMEVGCFGFGGL